MRAERDQVARGPEREVLEKVFTALLAFTRSLEVQERIFGPIFVPDSINGARGVGLV